MKKTILILFVALGAIVMVQDFLKKKKEHAPIEPKPYVILISFDGFRYDYNQTAHTPTLDSIAQIGAKADALVPVFPTKTFPNHYSIATGLYAENHGIVSNSFYAPDNKKLFNYRSNDDVTNGTFFKGEPIWVTAESQRVKTASFFWVGSEAKIKGYRPTYSKPYEHHFPYNQRFDTVINWLTKPYSERPHLITCYFDETDSKGHKYGPDSPELKASVQKLDSLLGLFLNQLNGLPIADSVNVIIVSDHGMAPLHPEKAINLKNTIKHHWIDTIYGSGAFMMVEPRKNCIDSIKIALTGITGLSAYKREDIPAKWHFKNSERVSELILLADLNYSLTYYPESGYDMGEHGYAPEYTEMHGIFYASGSAFKANYNAGILYGVDVYNLICKTLALEPAKNDGDTARIFKILK